MRPERLTRLPVLIAFIIIAAISAPPSIAANEGNGGWQPPPPMPDDFDWVQMTSGEWLKGEIIAMYEDSLEFDSEEFDTQKLDWEDIKEIRSAQVVQVAFDGNVISVGKLLVEGDSVRILGEHERTLERSQVLSITAGEPKERNYWSGKVTAGFNYRTGNTEQTETNTSTIMMRRTPKNRATLNYLGAFSESDGTTIADNQRASLGWNRFISKRFYLSPLLAEYYRDPFQNIGNRWTLGVGLGYQLVDTSNVTWDVDAGIAYQRTNFDDVLPGESDSADTPTLIVGTRYDNELTGWMDYFFDYRFYVVNEESGSYTHHMHTGFEFELIGDLDFDISFVWDRIQKPRPDSDGAIPKKDDFRTIFGLGYSF
jgi:hypothetical protein